MMAIFKKLFGSFSCPSIIKLNNFSNFQNYFLQKSMPLAMARLRTLHGICPNEVLHFLLDLFKYNDNSKNKFSDNYYRSGLVEAIVETLTPVVSAVLAPTGHNRVSSDALSPETKLILEEIVRYFNMEKLLPCYHHTVTVSCLKAFRHLQKMGHLPNNPKFFQHYTQYGLFRTVRVAAVEALVDIIKVDQQKEYLMFLLNLVEFDPVASFRYDVLRLLTENPPISNKDTNSLLNTEEVVEKIWTLMNNVLAFDPRLRAACVDMYAAFYGRQRPACLPKPELSMVLNLKEQKALVHPNLDENNSLNDPLRDLEPPREHYQPTLDFDAAFNKRKLEDSGTSLDEFDEKFNKEKRFKGMDSVGDQSSVEKPNLFAASADDYSPSHPLSVPANEDSAPKDPLNPPTHDSHHSDYYYNEDSNDYSTPFNKTSSFLGGPNENSRESTRSGDFNSPIQPTNLNEGLEDTDAQSYPPSSLAAAGNGGGLAEQTNQPQMPLTFSLSKQFGLSGLGGATTSSVAGGSVPSTSGTEDGEIKERVKEKKNKNKDKDRERDSSSKEHKKKKKHKKHKKKHKKEKREHHSELPSASSTSLPTALMNTNSSQLVMSDEDSNEEDSKLD